MKKCTSLILAIIMVFTMIPAAAYGAQSGTDNSEAESQQNEISIAEDNDEGQGVISIDNEKKNNSIKKDANQITQKSVKLNPVTIGKGYYQVRFLQDKINYKKVNVSLPYVSKLKSVKRVEKIKINVTMTYDGNVTQSTSKTVNLAKYSASNNSFKMNFPNYGSFKVSVTYYYKNGNKTTASKTMNIIAEEYNIAPIVATFPVAYFTLNLWNITKNEKGEPVPTFISLQRPTAYDWNKLPENTYWQPNLTKAQVEKKTNFDTKTAKFADYVKTLYKANPTAKFNLYINDAYCKYILQLMCANGIPESQYTVTLLSDGSGTYSHYNSVFNVTDPQTKYNKMAEGWKAAKKYAYDNGKYSLSVAPYYGSSNYATVAANEDSNTELWVGRKSGTYNIPDAGFTDCYINNSASVIQKSMNDMLKAATGNYNAETKQYENQKFVNAFKALYNFNNQMFEEAKAKGKKAMMILGSRTTSEPGYGTFSAYAKFLMMQYGDEYVYYYKGHPATPTALHPEKQAELNKLGIADVESSIPAELILFFYPDIYMAGYSSSTFQSVEKDEMATGVFGKTKAGAAADSSLQALVARDAFQFYMNKLSDAGLYSEIDASHENYSIEFQAAYLKAQGNLYDEAVYDYTDDVLYYYEVNGGKRILKKVAIGEISGITNTVDASKKQMVFNWKGVHKATGYNFQYKSKYDQTWKSVYTKVPVMTFNNLKAGQTLEGRVRVYITIDNKNYYGEWSPVSRGFVSATAVAATLNSNATALTATWKQVKTSYGKMYYRVAIRENQGAWSVKTTANNSKKYSSIKKGATYELKVAPVKRIDNKSYSGEYSSVKRLYVEKTNIVSCEGRTKGAIVNAKKVKKCTGYDYAYSRSSKFINAKHKLVKGASKTTCRITNLTSNRVYYVKVRPYKTKGGRNFYGKYSAASKVRVK